MLEEKMTELQKEKQMLQEKLEQDTKAYELQIKELVEVDKKQAEMIRQLRGTVAGQVQMIQLLTNSQAKQKELTEDLVQTKEEQAQVIALLIQEKDDLTVAQGALDIEKKALTDKMAEVKQQKSKLAAALNSEAEFKCQEIINYKLLPLTQDYLVSLAKKIDASLSTADIPKLINTVQAITAWPKDESTQRLQVKFNKLSELYETLALKNEEVIPSEKIVAFYEKLHKADKDISLHRDPEWKRYTRNTIAVLGIVLTGIVPGLAILAIAAQLRGTSLKFWTSSGQTFFKTAIEEEKNTPFPPIAPSV